MRLIDIQLVLFADAFVADAWNGILISVWGSKDRLKGSKLKLQIKRSFREDNRSKKSHNRQCPPRRGISRYGFCKSQFGELILFSASMPPRRATADNVSNMLAKWPTINDLPASIRRDMQVIQTTFSLEEHIKNIVSCNPYVPPTGDRCPINDLPNELLAHIFFLGTYEEDEEDDMYDDDDEDAVDDDDSGDERENGTLSNQSVFPFQVLVSHVCAHWRTVGEFT